MLPANVDVIDHDDRFPRQVACAGEGMAHIRLAGAPGQAALRQGGPRSCEAGHVERQALEEDFHVGQRGHGHAAGAELAVGFGRELIFTTRESPQDLLKRWRWRR